MSLQQTGFAQVKDSAEVLLQLVRDNGGFLPLNDDSAPEEVTRLTGTSKKFSNARWACSQARRGRSRRKRHQNPETWRRLTPRRRFGGSLDNFVFQRSLLAYHAASARIAGDVLEIGTGAGYGIEVAAPRAQQFRHCRQARPGAGTARPPQRRVSAGSGPAAGLPRPIFRLRDLVPGDRAYQTRCGVRAREIHRVLRPGDGSS